MSVSRVVQRKDINKQNVKVEKIQFFLSKTVFTGNSPKDRITGLTQERQKKLKNQKNVFT